MGGYVTKDKFINDDGQLHHYFNIPDYPLCGGTPPIYLSVIYQLKKDNVGLIITSLLDPLHSGRTIHHAPSFRSNETEWTDGDEGIEDVTHNLDIELLHVPINDECPPTNDSIDKLLNGVRDFLTRRPNEKIYVHCWKGSSRTSVILITLLRSIWNLSPEKAEELVTQANYKINISYFKPYLDCNRNPDFPHLAHSLYKSDYEPIIITSPDHKCWKLNNQ